MCLRLKITVKAYHSQSSQRINCEGLITFFLNGIPHSPFVCALRNVYSHNFLVNPAAGYTTSVFSAPTSSGAHTPISIDSHPTLEDINKFIVCEVAADWKQVATFLGVDYSVIRIAETDHRRCEHACTDIFERWLSWKPGTGREKRTWRTVFSAVEEAGHKGFSQQLQTEVLYLQ